MTTTAWNEVQARAAVPGSSILNRWRAEREASRSVSNATGNGMTETIISSDPRIIELLGSTPSAAGTSVTEASALRVSAVFACVARIAGAITSMPARIYERGPLARRTEVEDAPLWWLLNEQPSDRFTAASMWEQVTSHMLLRESGFVFIGRKPTGEVTELIPLPYDGVQVHRMASGKADRLRYSVQDVDRTYGVDQDDMLHFPGLGFNGLRAMSVLQYGARNATGNAAAMDEYSGKFFANGSHPSIVLEVDGVMKDEAVTNLQTAYQNKYSGMGNAHRLPLVLTNGIKAKPISLSAEDSQLLDARKYQVVDIARAFGVPPHLIGETSAATSWGSGLEEMTKAFLMFTVVPHLVRYEQELNRKLFRTYKRFIEFDREALQAGNLKAQADYFRAALGGPGSGAGWMTVDEVRRARYLPPLGGDAAKLFRPDTGPKPAPTPAPANPPTPDPGASA